MPKLKSEPIRIETGGTRGWQIRFFYQAGGERKYRSKLFSDSVCGGKGEAYRAAIRFRDEYRDSFTYRDCEIEPYRKRDERDNSGVPGIQFIEQEGASGPLVHVQAHVVGAGGKRRTRTRSLSKHGAVAAVREVCRFRYDGLQELHGEANPCPSWQHLYNEIARTAGQEYGLEPIEEGEL